jgi:phosphopantetheinyl transferase
VRDLHDRQERILTGSGSTGSNASVGRLLLRKACCESLGVAWGTLRLGRTADNKPFVEGDPPGLWDVNVSHHGNWVVLAGMHIAK